MKSADNLFDKHRIERLEVEFQELWHTPARQSSHMGPTENEQTSNSRSGSRSSAKSKKGAYRPGPTPNSDGYTVQPKDHAKWYVYILKLSNQKVVKVGMSHDPSARQRAYNHTILPEITSLSWTLEYTQEFSDAETALSVEQEVLAKFAEAKLPSNGEILRGVDPMDVRLAVIASSRTLAQRAE